MDDQVVPYLFEHASIRVQVVRLTRAWQMLHRSHDLSTGATHMLGRCAAATALLATTIKFEGRINVQLQSDGPLRLLLCQCTHELGLRGMARVAEAADLSEAAGRDSLQGLAGKGHIAITIENTREDKRYQGITPIMNDSLASSFEYYFDQSEQLPTRLWLAADAQTASGLMIQRMPGGDTREEDWERAQRLAETITADELLGLDAQEVVRRLYHEEDLRRLDGRPVRFYCRCARHSVSAVLQGLGEAEVQDILAEQGRVKVNCDFCGEEYLYDHVDAAALFADGTPQQGPDRVQ